MRPHYFRHIIFAAIFLTSTLLRLELTFVNRQANDQHIEVVRFILTENYLPDKSNCNECFQPKLYHLTSALVIKMLNMEDRPKNDLVAVMQWINFIVGLATLAMVWLFIEKLPFTQTLLKTAAFALLALNPKVIGINAQSTNDTFAILFSTWALYATFTFLKKPGKFRFFLIVLVTLLAITSKTNAWVTAIAILCALFAKASIQSETRRANHTYALIFLVVVPTLMLLNPLSQTIHNLQKFGTPLTLNIEKRPPFPHPFSYTPGCASKDEGYDCRAGILSLKSGFLTFKLRELLSHPRLENGFENYPAHRTSFWTQLYARAHSATFDNWPGSWGSRDGDGFTHKRSIYVLALLPTLTLLTGLGLDSTRLGIAALRRTLPDLQGLSFGLFVFALLGYIAFTTLYTAVYRDFAIMKAVFIYPALLTFPLFFMQAGKILHQKLSSKFGWVLVIFYLLIIELLALYIYDIIFLINHIKAYGPIP